MNSDHVPPHDEPIWEPTTGHGYPRGRPTRLTQRVGTDILDSIRLGQSVPRAARRAGVHPNTVNNWLKRADRDEERGMDEDGNWSPERGQETLYLKFMVAVKKMEAEAEYRHLQQIDQGMDNWTSSAWWLERKYPDDWGLKKDQFPVGSVNFLKQRPDKPEDALDPALVDDGD
jgi:transposase